MLPPMFDYLRLTSYRREVEALNLPILGCSGESTALSTNKACAKPTFPGAIVRAWQAKIRSKVY